MRNFELKDQLERILGSLSDIGGTLVNRLQFEVIIATCISGALPRSMCESLCNEYHLNLELFRERVAE